MMSGSEWLPHTSLFSNLSQSSSRHQRSYYFKKLYRKSSIKPPVAYLISDLPGGWGLFTKSSDKDIFGSFSVLLPHILRNQDTTLRLKYINSTPFFPKPY